MGCLFVNYRVCWRESVDGVCMFCVIRERWYSWCLGWKVWIGCVVFLMHGVKIRENVCDIRCDIRERVC